VISFLLSQEKYIHDLLDPTRYHHIVVSLVYLGVTRPDISYFVYIMSQFVSVPIQIHYSHLLRVMCYLRGISLNACSFHTLALYNYRHIVILPRLVITLTVILFLPIVFFLVVPLLLGRLRSRK
jgi:hypothetical protein